MARPSFRRRRSPAVQEEDGMEISVLGVDLGKNVCASSGWTHAARS
jgi:hypothetical protein